MKIKNNPFVFPSVLTLITAAVCLLILIPSGSETPAPPATGLAQGFSLAQKPEITLFNMTDRTFDYVVKPLDTYEQPSIKQLRPGQIHRFEGGNRLEFRTQPNEDNLLYFFWPGEDYSIREIQGLGPRIFRHIKGHSGAVQLAPYVPSPRLVIDKMLEVTGVTSRSVVYDLGCGDGRVVIAAAAKYGARGVGIDIDPERIIEAEQNAAEAGVENLVEFRLSDIFEAEISDATVVYLYLFPAANRLLRPFLEKNLADGTIVASLSFSMPGWEDRLTAMYEVLDEQRFSRTIYVYSK